MGSPNTGGGHRCRTSRRRTGLGVGGVGITAMIIGGLASISQVGGWLANRIRPMIEQVIPRLVTVAQRPEKLVEGSGGILLLNLAYCACLVASVHGRLPFAARSDCPCQQTHFRLIGST